MFDKYLRSLFKNINIMLKFLVLYILNANTVSIVIKDKAQNIKTEYILGNEEICIRVHRTIINGRTKFYDPSKYIYIIPCRNIVDKEYDNGFIKIRFSNNQKPPITIIGKQVDNDSILSVPSRKILEMLTFNLRQNNDVSHS